VIDGRRKSVVGKLNNDQVVGGSNSEQSSPQVNSDFEKKTKFNQLLVKSHITPNQVTVGGILLSLVCAYFIAEGYFWIGIALITASGLMDFLDGAVARARGVSSIRGKFLDSVSDRVIDTFIFGALSWYLIGTKRGELALLPLAILASGFVISYERAKAESLGLSGKGGLMERAERLIGLGIVLSFNGIILIPGLILLLALTLITVVHRFLNIWGQASIQDNADFIYNEWLTYAKEKRQKRLESRTHHFDERFRLQRISKLRASGQIKKTPKKYGKSEGKRSKRSLLTEKSRRSKDNLGYGFSSSIFRRSSKKP
jgi:CDP-diacylglycerol--glycerol-3-phosphate 3-phosphatidyltransferase